MLTAAIGLIAATYVYAATRPLPDGVDEAAVGPAGSPLVSPDASPAAPAAAQPHGPGGSWQVVFDDEFDGQSLDAAKWKALDNWDMNNVKNYARNVSVASGNLVLTLQSSTAGAGVSSARYDGAGAGSYQLAVGDYVEARVYVPGDAMEPIYNWPAWWVSGPNWPAGGEHDILEGLGGDPAINYHSPSGAHNQGVIPGAWNNAYHIYGLYRHSHSADVYWDGVLVKSYPTDDNGQPEALIFNVGASHSRPAHTGTASQIKVDWVRAWRAAQ
jgi:hypothetical protein